MHDAKSFSVGVLVLFLDDQGRSEGIRLLFVSTAGGLPGNQVAARRLSNNPERALASEPESPLVHRLPAFVDLAFLEMALEKDQRIVSQHAGTPVKTNYKL
jgi:hypothetical protein